MAQSEYVRKSLEAQRRRKEAVQLFIDNGGNAAAVGRHYGVSTVTAREIIKKGFEQLGYPPIFKTQYPDMWENGAYVGTV